MRRLFAVLLSAFLVLGFAPVAHADIGGLTPCAENARFQQRAGTATTTQAKRRFEMYSKALCGADGLPHLIVDGRWSHAGDFMIPVSPSSTSPVASAGLAATTCGRFATTRTPR